MNVTASFWTKKVTGHRFACHISKYDVIHPAYTIRFAYVEQMYSYGQKFADEVEWSNVTITEKMDGCLCVLYYYNGIWEVASKGLFFTVCFNILIFF